MKADKRKILEKMIDWVETISLINFDTSIPLVLNKLNVRTFNFSIFIEFYIKYYNRI